jgi:hypothetical protein
VQVRAGHIAGRAGEAELLARGLGQALARLGVNSDSTSGDQAGAAASALCPAALDPLAGLLKLTARRVNI